MDNRKIALELLKVAKSLESSKGTITMMYPKASKYDLNNIKLIFKAIDVLDDLNFRLDSLEESAIAEKDRKAAKKFSNAKKTVDDTSFILGQLEFSFLQVGD